MTELAPRESTELVNPQTGELVDCADLRKAGEWLRDLRRMKLQIDDQIRAIEEIALEEMSRRGQGTVREGVVQLTRRDSKRWDYDMDELAKLIDAGLPPERYAEVVKQTVTEKVDRNALKQIAAANPEYAEIVARAEREVPGRVFLEVKTGGK